MKKNNLIRIWCKAVVFTLFACSSTAQAAKVISWDGPFKSLGGSFFRIFLESPGSFQGNCSTNGGKGFFELRSPPSNLGIYRCAVPLISRSEVLAAGVPLPPHIVGFHDTVVWAQQDDVLTGLGQNRKYVSIGVIDGLLQELEVLNPNTRSVYGIEQGKIRSWSLFFMAQKDFTTLNEFNNLISRFSNIPEKIEIYYYINLRNQSKPCAVGTGECPQQPYPGASPIHGGYGGGLSSGGATGGG